MALDERTRIAHLLRRAGFGAPQAELDAYGRQGYERTVDTLIDYERIPTNTWAGLETFDQSIPSFGLLRPRLVAQLQTWWYERMFDAHRPLQEKMTLFWNCHLTTSARAVDEPVFILWQNQLHRDSALERFDRILRGISRSPAMMVYLDTYVNGKSAPNENYARELLELYGLGIGHYTENDVKDAARAFTGWNFDDDGRFQIRREDHDDGMKAVLGRSGRWGGDDVIGFVLEHPAMPSFITGKLWSAFVWEDPTGAELAPAVDVFRSSGFSVRETMRFMLKSPAFTSERAYRSRLKTPVELVLSTHRLLGIRPAGQANQAMTRMGQNPWEPPNPKGWVDDTTGYLNATTWLERVNWANTMSQRSQPQPGPPGTLPPPSAVLEVSQFLPEGVDTAPVRAVDHLLTALVDGRVSPEARSALLHYAGSRLDEATARGLLYLVLASPEFQLA